MTGETDSLPLALTLRETLAIYLMLTKHEDELDDTQREILARICRRVYEKLSVEDIENIEGLYESL